MFDHLSDSKLHEKLADVLDKDETFANCISVFKDKHRRMAHLSNTKRNKEPPAALVELRNFCNSYIRFRYGIEDFDLERLPDRGKELRFLYVQEAFETEMREEYLKHWDERPNMTLLEYDSAASVLIEGVNRLNINLPEDILRMVFQYGTPCAEELIVSERFTHLDTIVHDKREIAVLKRSPGGVFVAHCGPITSIVPSLEIWRAVHAMELPIRFELATFGDECYLKEFRLSDFPLRVFNSWYVYNIKTKSFEKKSHEHTPILVNDCFVSYCDLKRSLELRTPLGTQIHPLPSSLYVSHEVSVDIHIANYSGLVLSITNKYTHGHCSIACKHEKKFVVMFGVEEKEGLVGFPEVLSFTPVGLELDDHFTLNEALLPDGYKLQMKDRLARVMGPQGKVLTDWMLADCLKGSIVQEPTDKSGGFLLRCEGVCAEFIPKTVKFSKTIKQTLTGKKVSKRSTKKAKRNESESEDFFE